jgi:arginine/lysine/ornithine decarboxylase
MSIGEFDVYNMDNNHNSMGYTSHSILATGYVAEIYVRQYKGRLCANRVGPPGIPVVPSIPDIKCSCHDWKPVF